MPPKRIVILTPKSMTKSAFALKAELKKHLSIPILIVNPYSLTYQGRHTDYVINWGYSKQTEFLIVANNNNPSNISNAVDKIKAFELFNAHGVPTVEWTVDQEKAKEWHSNNKTVIGRTIITSHGGKGIFVLDNTTPFKDNCKLYTLYKKKKHEYRVHIYNNDVIDITQKKKKSTFDKGLLNTKVRNYHNGWVYCRSDIYYPADLRVVALAAIEALSLKHGAVDIIWNELENKSFVLEVNTAPGLTGTTIEKYTQAFLEDLKS